MSNSNEAIEKEGWDYLDDILMDVYHCEPLETYGTIMPYGMGGDDPLPQVSVYETEEYYHYITYGFSNLGKVALNEDGTVPEYSGYGFELTLKVKKEQVNDLIWIVSLLQGYGRYIYETGNYFTANEYIGVDPDSTEGINPEKDSTITGFVTAYDNDFGIAETPNGKVEFVQLVGITQPELKKICEKEIRAKEMVEKLYELDSDLVTDLYRDSIV